MEPKKINAVRELLNKALTAEDGAQALYFTQAASCAANALLTLAELEKLRKSNE